MEIASWWFVCTYILYFVLRAANTSLKSLTHVQALEGETVVACPMRVALICTESQTRCSRYPVGTYTPQSKDALCRTGIYGVALRKSALQDEQKRNIPNTIATFASNKWREAGIHRTDYLSWCGHKFATNARRIPNQLQLSARKAQPTSGFRLSKPAATREGSREG